MTTPAERWLLDTNVWIFGLRGDANAPACAELLNHIGSFVVCIPLQVIKELTVNLADDEIHDFYQMLGIYPECIELSWEAAPVERIRFFEKRGCRKGDAVIAAHAEMLHVTTIISENRQFLRTLTGLPVEVVNSTTALSRLG